MSILHNDTDFGNYTPQEYSDNKGLIDCGYFATGKVNIGQRFRDSQISAATPRVRGEVEYLGEHAEQLQRALLAKERGRIADVLLAAALGASLAAVLFIGLSA